MYACIYLVPVPLQVVVNEKRSTIHRTYKELLWLHRNLARRVELGGNIVRRGRGFNYGVVSLLSTTPARSCYGCTEALVGGWG